MSWSRPLGSSPLEVSALGYGAMELRGTVHHKPRPIDEDEAARLLHAVLDSGVTFIDTSIDYGGSEELIGAALSGRRDEYVLASKCGCPLVRDPAATGNGPGAHDWSPARVTAGVEQSLRRLRTDRLDLVQVHMSPSRAALEQEGTVEALQKLQEQGKIRFLGSSSVLPRAYDLIDMGVFDAFQLPYSALARQHAPVIDAAAAAGAGVIIRGAVDRGSLLSKADPTKLWDQARLDELADGLPRMQFLLRFSMSHPGISTTLVGTANVGHWEENVAAARLGPLEPDVYAEANRRLDEASAVALA
jgi:aryl-alcohol dehydrogenase-like predicted oxidoreductase